MSSKTAKKVKIDPKTEVKPPKIEVPDLTGKKILIATPAYDGKVGLPYMNSLFATLNAAKAAGADVSYAIYANSGSVPRTRNQAVAAMMGHGFTDLFFIDADMGWDAQDFCRMCAWNGVGVLAATYPARSEDNPRWIVVWPKEIKQHPDTGFLTAQRAGTGFMRIERQVFEKLEELHPELHFEAPHTQEENQKPHLHAFFKYELVEGADGKRGHLSEDYYFCDLAREAGFPIWVDPTIRMEHHGFKKFEGRFSDHVKIQEIEEGGALEEK